MRVWTRLMACFMAFAIVLTTSLEAFAGSQSDAEALSEMYNTITSPLFGYNANQVAPFNLFFGNRREEVHSGNGNLTINETDLELPGRNGLDLTLSRTYRSQTASLYNMSTRVESSPSRYYVSPGIWGMSVHTPEHYQLTGQSSTCWAGELGYCEYDDWQPEYSGGYLVWNSDGSPSYYLNQWPHSWLRRPRLAGEGQQMYRAWSSALIQSTWTPGIVYVPGHYVTYTDYYVVDSRTNDTHLDLRHGLGVGWQWDFPTLEIRGSEITYHTSDLTLVVDNNSPSRFKNYELLDIVFSNDNNSFSNGQHSSRYKVTEKGGRVSYFGSDGRLLGIKDRFGNTIVFRHTTWKDHPVINQITDSVGRVITIEYSNTTVTVTAPGNQVLTYTLASLPNGKSQLSSVTDPMGRVTHYSYTQDEALFSFVYKNPAHRSVRNVFLNLREIVYPTQGRTQFTYEKVTDNLGRDGTRELYKIKSRQDIVGGEVRNRADYSYMGQPGGYPTHQDPGNLPSNYTYHSTMTRADSSSVTATYNHRHLPIRTQVTGQGVDVTTETTYHPSYKTPAQQTTTYRAGTQSRTVTKTTTFNQYGNLVEDVDPQGATTTYSYESAYHMLTSMVTEQNSSGTPIRIEYDVVTGVVTAERRFYTENGVEKTVLTNHEYDQHFNRTKTIVSEGNVRTREIQYEYSQQYQFAFLTRQIESFMNESGQTQLSTLSYDYDFATGRLTSYTDPLGAVTSVSYDVLGRPLQITHPAVNGVAASRSFIYDDQNLRTQVTDEGGLVTHYVYDQLDNLLTTERTFNGATITLAERRYNSLGQLVEEYDANRNRTQYTYDSRGRIVGVTYPDLTISTLVYSDIEPSVTEIDGDGRTLVKRLDVMGRTVEVESRPHPVGPPTVERMTYDYAGNLLSVTDARGGVTRFEYDRLNRLTKAIDPLDNEFSYQYDASGNKLLEQGPLGRTTAYEYDMMGRLVREIDSLGGEVCSSFDAKGRLTAQTDRAGNTTRFEYDARDRLVRQIDAVGGITSHTYDIVGNVLQTTDARGHVTSFAYDNWYRLIQETNPEGGTVSYAYDLNGNLTQRMDPLGGLTQFGYDARNRVVETKQLLQRGTPDQYLVEVFEYDAAGNRTRVTNAAGQVTRFTYDGVNRLVQTERKLGAGWVSESVQYDLVGNISAHRDARGNQSHYEYDYLNRLTGVTDANGNRWTYQYDAHGNLLRITNPSLAVTRFEYDALNQRVKEIDPLGYETQIVYDANGNRLYTATNNLVAPSKALMSIDIGAGIASGWRASHWTNADDVATVSLSIDDRAQKITISNHAPGNDTLYYDYVVGLFSNDGSVGAYPITPGETLSASVDFRQSGGHFAQFAIAFFDSAQNVIGMEYSPPFERSVQWGRQAFQTAPAPATAASAEVSLIFRATAEFAEESLNGSAWFRLLQVEKGRASAGPKSFNYDALDRLVAVTAAGGVQVAYAYDAVGNRVSMQDQHGTTAYAYDRAGRLVQVTVPDSKSIRYNYNSLGLVEQLTDYGGNVTDYTYDLLGRVNTVKQGATTVASFAYNTAGYRSSVTLGNGVTNQYFYDDLNRLTGLDTLTGNGVSLSTMSYGYDSGGNLTDRVENGVQVTYEYDNLNQLTRVTQVGGPYTTYGYDPAGNREHAFHSQANSTDTYLYDAADRLVTAVLGGVAYMFEWDKQGNQLSDGRNLYAYDGMDRLVHVTTPEGEVSYAYNGDGMVVRRTTATESTEFYYWDQHVLNEANDAGVITASMVRGAGSYLTREIGAQEPFYYQYNYHGDVVTLLGSSGSELASYNYDEFGNLTAQSGQAMNPFLYSGEYFDHFTQLYYLRARFYSPKIGRFVTQDTWKGIPMDPLTLNLYTYVRNNPIKYIDPTGHCAEKFDEGACVNESGDFVRGYVSPAGTDLVTRISNVITNPNFANLTQAGDTYVVLTKDSNIQLYDALWYPIQADLVGRNEMTRFNWGSAQVAKWFAFALGTDVAITLYNGMPGAWEPLIGPPVPTTAPMNPWARYGLDSVGGIVLSMLSDSGPLGIPPVGTTEYLFYDQSDPNDIRKLLIVVGPQGVSLPENGWTKLNASQWSDVLKNFGFGR